VKLTQKQEAFALAYCEMGNATSAYQAVYQPKKASTKTMNEAASRLLKNSKVAARIAEIREKAARNVGLSIERTLLEVARIAYFDKRKLYDPVTGELLPPHRWDDDTAAAISHMGRGGPVPFDKGSALEKAMKHYGLYERDNKQKADPIAELMKHIATHQQGIPVKP
jgi:phage terminase small subunit